MATTSEIYVQIEDIEPVLNEWKKYFRTGKALLSYSEYEFPFNNETIVFSKDRFYDWVDVQLNLDSINLYRFDEIFRRISQILNTTLIFIYYQSTADEGRVAKFNKGILNYSLYQKHLYPIYSTSEIHRFFVTDDFGIENSKLEVIQNLKFGQDVMIFNWDFLNSFRESESVFSLPNVEAQYLYQEIIM